MAKASALPAWQQALMVLTTTVVGVIVIACLYWAQTIFIPVAMAIFLTFLLSPLVSQLQRRGLGRVPSVIVVVLLAAALLGGVGYLMTRQMVGLVEGLPKYSDNIKGKVKSLRELMQTERAGQFGKMIEEITNEVMSPPTAPEGGAVPGKETEPSTGTERPAPVIIRSDSPPWLSRLFSTLGSVTESLGGLLLSAVLVVFMLLKREDLRNRLIRLAGHGRLTVTTKAVDEAGQRISRFLLTQAILNGAYGLALALGLYLIGVEYALLWGFLVAFMRYIPYIGIWVGALPPIILSLAQFPGWLQPSLVLGLFLVLELVTVNFLEPRFFGQSMGVSEVALLVAAAFWAWMWGPIGLVLSSPLTVVLVVIGKYVPHLEFLDVLLGDEPALDPNISYYQRLLAHDQDEAAQLVLAQAKESAPDQVYDDLLVPTLNYARRDRERDDLTEADEQFIFQATQEIIEDLGERQEAEEQKEEETEKKTLETPERPKMYILGMAARDEGDRLCLEMLQQLLDPAKWELEITGTETMTTELLALAAEKKPALICISSLPPGGLAHTRYLCKRLRARLPNVKLVVGRWGLKGNVEENIEQLRAVGVEEVETTLLAMQNRLTGWLPVLESQETKRPKVAV